MLIHGTQLSNLFSTIRSVDPSRRFAIGLLHIITLENCGTRGPVDLDAIRTTDASHRWLTSRETDKLHSRHDTTELSSDLNPKDARPQ